MVLWHCRQPPRGRGHQLRLWLGLRLLRIVRDQRPAVSRQAQQEVAVAHADRLRGLVLAVEGAQAEAGQTATLLEQEMIRTNKVGQKKKKVG